MKITTTLILIVLSALAISSTAETLNCSIFDYADMSTLNSTLIKSYASGLLIDSCNTNSSNNCILNLTNGSYNILLNKSGYKISNEEYNLSGNSSTFFLLEGLQTNNAGNLYLSELNQGYSLCVDNLSNCFGFNETILLTEKRDYILVFKPHTQTIASISFITSTLEDVIKTVLSVLLLIIIVGGLFYVFKKHLI
jgi:hypothetical protein